MPNILIIGSNSFIGRNFMIYSKFKDVKEFSLIEHKPEEIDFEGIDVVLHLAAIVHQFEKIPKNEYYRVNRDLSLRVAELAKAAGVKHFIFMSTFKVYGELFQPEVVLDEDSPCYPADHYGKSKFEAEKGLLKMQDPDFTVSIVRTPLVYGIGVKANMLSLLKLVENVRILPFGNLRNCRCYSFVENLIAFIDRIVEKAAPGVFIAMDIHPLSTTDLVQYISKFLGKKVILFRMPNFLIKLLSTVRPGTINSLYGSFKSNNNKTREILEFNPPYSSEEGFRRMVTAYKNKPWG